MDISNWRPAQGGEPTLDAGNWRTRLQPDSRRGIVNEILETLKRNLPFSGPEGLEELNKIAVRFEEKIYTAATSRADYLRKISLKMLTMEKKLNVVGPIVFKMMDTSNWWPAQGGEPKLEASNWRTQLQPDSRRWIVNKIMETLKRHLTFSGPEGLQELNKIVVWFEEKIYTEATSQADYLRKISLKMLTMEKKSQNINPLSSIQASNSANPTDPVMDTSNWWPAQGGEPKLEASNWRTQLQPDSRRWIVNKIMETLKRHLTFSGPEGLQELNKIAVWFEEKIYTEATSQDDYLRKISLKMLTMEQRSQNTNPLSQNT